ncbi:MAG: TIGR01906 family membrane protein [Nanoarchaeota archaeon]
MKAIRYFFILTISFIVLSVAFNIYAFNNYFYKHEFEKYGVYSEVKNADELHGKVIDFIKGRTNDLPDDFSQREKSHLEDVRNIISASNKLFYFFVVLYLVLFVYLSKKSKNIKKEFGNIIFYGGIFTIVFGALIFLFIFFNFDSTFESFHKTFFPQGNYMFDPSKEIIVRLYPEQLFMDIGLRIAMATFIISLLLIISGAVSRRRKI